MEIEVYKPKHHVRFVTAASLFDGHDAAINIMRRILQASGAEVIHLGHNRSVLEIVQTAIQEDAQGIAVSSYQGGHMEFFKYMHDLLDERGAGHIRVFGGGGGVIVPEEIAELEDYGIEKIFSPDDGMRLGLQGMINYMLEKTDFSTVENLNGNISSLPPRNASRVAKVLTAVEENTAASVLEKLLPSGDGAPTTHAPVIGITGTGGAGKSTLTDELVRRFLNDFEDVEIAVLSVDPTRFRTGGALLGDRIRMNSIYGDSTSRVFMRSFATRQANAATSVALEDSIKICRASGFDLIVLETAGIGQSDIEIAQLSDVSIYVMTQDFGAPTQLEKIGMLDVADFVAINKFEKRGSRDALRDVRKQYQRNRQAFDKAPDTMPVYPTMASRFNDPGVTALYLNVLDKINTTFDFGRPSNIFNLENLPDLEEESLGIIPPDRQRYLGEIADKLAAFHSKADREVDTARKWGQAVGVIEQIDNWQKDHSGDTRDLVSSMADHWWNKLSSRSKSILQHWDDLAAQYDGTDYSYSVRGKEIHLPLATESLSGLRIPKVALPRVQDPGERLRFALKENLPGYYPFTAGVFPFKRSGEDPTRMFAGEGSPERTNRRFHLVSVGMPAKRLSTAFDSVTLYGHDPHERPDIYGKVGNSGVSICTLDDMKKLYSGFDLCDPATSVSMTINGPAPMILAMFLNTAIDQQVEKYLKDNDRWTQTEEAFTRILGDSRPEFTPYGAGGKEESLPEGHDGFGLDLLGVTGEDLVAEGVLTMQEYTSIKADALHRVRGTVQADILKEDQAQNTCIFSTEFGLRMMGDIQQYFIDNSVRNYYSVSISGYHIAEAGANPISQLAFTLSNGFTFVEYYLGRGMSIDDFAPNFSFFFSNGLDPEYTVIGRVARRIWSVAMRNKYGANERSQKLKYHIQTSGRSLHAKEIQFNDIRTTLQALLAIYDNCNSLHTNAYDEAITTPTEESVRRAMAIQLIINKELGLAKNENPLQGAYIVDELTDLVEEAVLAEFRRLDDRGGVLGAMETMYQRGKIQEESLFYEHKKHSGELPVVGINTFIGTEGETDAKPVVLMRSTTDEKDRQIKNLRAFQHRNDDRSSAALEHLQTAAREGHNLFDALLATVRVCSLGQITNALFEVGGQYRRNM
ncbi:MAG: methylmalonyl-CoA mutase family protein [Rhodothermales bacterium]|nr:methylmalonyl-CoA mutase family protein [Rhodothermales bacterium]